MILSSLPAHVVDRKTHPDDISRLLTWSRHDVRVERYILMLTESRDIELTAAGARQPSRRPAWLAVDRHGPQAGSLEAELASAPTPGLHAGERLGRYGWMVTRAGLAHPVAAPSSCSGGRSARDVNPKSVSPVVWSRSYL